MEFENQMSVSDFEAVQQLKRLRDDNIRNSELVLKLAEPLIFSKPRMFGDDIYNVYEQVIVAGLDLARFDVVDQCMDILDKKFPDSMRVHKLKGLRLEACQQFEDAETLYKSMLEIDSSNAICRKRLVAIKKALGDFSGAKKELCEHVQNFQTDFEAWHELADLYIQDCEYSKAVFCLEELILSHAYNHLYYEKYAQVKYSQALSSSSPIEHMETARKYFAQAVKLSGENSKSVRALIGMIMCSHYLATNPKCSSKQKKDNVKFAVWAFEMLTNKYGKYEEAAELTPPSSYLGLAALVESLNINI